jgi:hypothetical protein
MFIEELELRCVPAIYRWNRDLLSGDNNWNNYKNWDRKHETTGIWTACSAWVGLPYPGKDGAVGDDVEFWANAAHGTVTEVNMSVTLRRKKGWRKKR